MKRASHSPSENPESFDLDDLQHGDSLKIVYNDPETGKPAGWWNISCSPTTPEDPDSKGKTFKVTHITDDGKKVSEGSHAEIEPVETFSGEFFGFSNKDTMLSPGKSISLSLHNPREDEGLKSQYPKATPENPEPAFIADSPYKPTKIEIQNIAFFKLTKAPENEDSSQESKEGDSSQDLEKTTKQNPVSNLLRSMADRINSMIRRKTSSSKEIQDSVEMKEENMTPQQIENVLPTKLNMLINDAPEDLQQTFQSLVDNLRHTLAEDHKVSLPSIELRRLISDVAERMLLERLKQQEIDFLSQETLKSGLLSVFSELMTKTDDNAIDSILKSATQLKTQYLKGVQSAMKASPKSLNGLGKEDYTEALNKVQKGDVLEFEGGSLMFVTKSELVRHSRYSPEERNMFGYYNPDYAMSHSSPKNLLDLVKVEKKDGGFSLSEADGESYNVLMMPETMKVVAIYSSK